MHLFLLFFVLIFHVTNCHSRPHVVYGARFSRPRFKPQPKKPDFTQFHTHKSRKESRERKRNSGINGQTYSSQQKRTNKYEFPKQTNQQTNFDTFHKKSKSRRKSAFQSSGSQTSENSESDNTNEKTNYRSQSVPPPKKSQQTPKRPKTAQNNPKQSHQTPRYNSDTRKEKKEEKTEHRSHSAPPPKRPYDRFHNTEKDTKKEYNFDWSSKYRKEKPKPKFEPKINFLFPKPKLIDACEGYSIKGRLRKECCDKYYIFADGSKPKTIQQFKALYKILVLQFHPDKPSGNETEFKIIQKCYEEENRQKLYRF